MPSPQTLSDPDRRLVAAWAADCAEHVEALFAAAAPGEDRVAQAIARARAYSRGELGAAQEIRRRFVADRAAGAATSPAAVAAARAAAQAAGVAHMGAHALGTAAYAAKAAALAAPEQPDALLIEVGWQLSRLSPSARSALRKLPALGTDPAGPLGPGLLTTGVLAQVIRRIQADVATS